MLSADPSQRVTAPRADRDPWFYSQWSVFWTLVGALLTAALIATIAGWLFVAALLNGMSERSRFRDFAPSARPQSRVSVSAPAAARFQLPETETVRVPGQSTEACLSATGGVANEQYARCRRGYSYTRPVDP